MGRPHRRLIVAGVFALVACSNEPPRPDVAAGGASVSNSSSASSGQGGSVSVSSSVVGSGGAGGAGGEGGSPPPKPIDCATLNPGFVCVEDRHCPAMTKEVLDACGPWHCVFIVPPDPDAGIPGKRGCMLSPKP